MPFQHAPLSRYQQQFRLLAGRLRKLMQAGNWWTQDGAARRQLLDKLHRLYRFLAPRAGAARLRRVLGTAAVLLGGAALSPVHAQIPFGGAQINPFGLQPIIGELAFSSLADLDGDGDFDLLLGVTTYENDISEFEVRIVENTGTPQAPAFATTFTVLDLDLAPPSADVAYFGAEAADLDGDGDLDIMVGSYQYYGGSGQVYYFENTGSATSPSFGASQANPFGLDFSGVSSVVIPVMVDIDRDGDLDLFSVLYEEYGDPTRIMFCENTGSAMAPAFAAPVVNPFGIDVSNEVPLLDFGDLDNDGDLDLLVGGRVPDLGGYNYEVTVAFVENIGTPSQPAFGPQVESPFGIQPMEALLLLPLLADLDADGDTDILIWGEYSGKDYSFNWNYFENELINTSVREPLLSAQLRLFPTVTAGSLTLEVAAEQAQAYYQVDILDAQGRVVAPRQEAVGNETTLQMQLDAGRLPAGTYFVRVRTPEGVAISRFIRA